MAGALQTGETEGAWERTFEGRLSRSRTAALQYVGFKMDWIQYADDVIPELIGFRVLEKSDETCDAVSTAEIRVERTAGWEAETLNDLAANAAPNNLDTGAINEGYRLRFLGENADLFRWAAELAEVDAVLTANP